MNLEEILETPYMMEIVMQVLPQMIKKYSNVNNIKKVYHKIY